METEKKESQTHEEELAIYEKLRQKVTKSLGELNEKINTETISQAMDKAVSDLKDWSAEETANITSQNAKNLLKISL